MGISESNQVLCTDSGMLLACLNSLFYCYNVFLSSAYLHSSQYTETPVFIEPLDSAWKGMSFNFLGKMWESRSWDPIKPHKMK